MFETFVERLLEWAAWWNTEHRPERLGGRTPAEARAADPTPVQDVPREDLRLLTLEDDGRQRVISGKGVQWRSRFYVADWMAGRGGDKVRIRYMPHHEHEIEVFDARTGRHLGAAFLSDAATPEQVAEVRRARASAARRLRADLKAAEATRRERFAAVTVAEPARALGALTAEQAADVLNDGGDEDLARLGRRDVVPLLAPPASWALPLRAPDVEGQL